MTLLDQAFTRRNDITKATADQTTLYVLTKLKLYLSNISNTTQDFTLSCLHSAGKYVNRTKLQSKKSSILSKQQKDSSSRFSTNQNSLKLNLYSSEFFVKRSFLLSTGWPISPDEVVQWNNFSIFPRDIFIFFSCLVIDSQTKQWNCEKKSFLPPSD